MIRSKEDLLFYLEADRISLGRERISVFSVSWFRECLFPDRIYRFQRQLRKVEYLQNCRSSSLFSKIRFLIAFRKFLKQSVQLGFSIHPNNFGPGLAIAHHGTIVVNQSARIGKNCRLHVCVNIGTEAGYDNKAPIIGDNVYLGPGAKIFGEIIISSGCVIGANSVVNKSFLEEGILLAGVPARPIGKIDSSRFIRPGADLVGKPEYLLKIGQPAHSFNEEA